jgi:hypothetical protein
MGTYRDRTVPAPAHPLSGGVRPAGPWANHARRNHLRCGRDAHRLRPACPCLLGSLPGAAGHRISREELQKYSGMDGGDMLDRLLPRLSKEDKDHILKIQGETYRKDYLQLGAPFDGVRRLFPALGDRNVGIATSCKGTARIRQPDAGS